MLIIHQPPRAWGLPNYSAACMKLETWLRMTGIPYEIGPADCARSPKGKLPFIEDGGALVGDSSFILEHLKKAYGKDPDARLRSEERAISLAFRRMIKEHLFWCMTQDRYFEDRNWPTYKALILPLVAPDAPPDQQEKGLSEFREYMRGQIKGHGMGRHSPEEIARLGVADLLAISDFLADKPFFMGEEPTTADATVYAYVANILFAPIEGALKDHGRKTANLMPYCERMRERFFPELPAL